MVILILGLVAATIIPRLVYSDATKAAECRANVTYLNAVLDDWTQKGGKSPANEAEYDLLIVSDRDHFPSGAPKCPCGRPYEYNPATGHIIPHQH